MFLIDTNVISEMYKSKQANQGVVDFFRQVQRCKQNVYFSVITKIPYHVDTYLN